MDELKPAETRSGVVKILVDVDEEKGRCYGFIRDSESKVDIYFHESELVDVGFDELKAGDHVLYFVIRQTSGKNAGKLQAIEVVKDIA